LTPSKVLRYDCQFDSRFLDQALVAEDLAEAMKGHDGQGKKNLSAEQTAPREGTRIQGTHEHEEWASGAQAPPHEGS
jgi:hypothetical protein